MFQSIKEIYKPHDDIYSKSYLLQHTANPMAVPQRRAGAVRSASPYVHSNRFEGGVIAEAAAN